MIDPLDNWDHEVSVVFNEEIWYNLESLVRAYTLH
jgi:hypothetical protein